VHDGELGAFVGVARTLRRELERLEEAPELVRDFTRSLRAFTTRAMQSLLPTSDPAVLTAGDLRMIERLGRQLAAYVPEHEALLSRVVETLRTLSRRTSVPALVDVDAVAAGLDVFQIGIEHDDPAFMKASREFVATRWPGATVVDACAEASIHESIPLIVMGPTWLYPPSLFLAPVVPSITVVAPGCVSDRIIDPQASMLDGGIGTAGRWTVQRRGIDELPAAGRPAEQKLELQEAEFQRVIELAPARPLTEEELDGDELVEASLVLLAGCHGIFLDHEAEAHVLLWDVASSPRFDRVAVDELEPGMYLVDRDPAGHDTLEAIVRATIPPARLAELLALRRTWKDQLARRCARDGVHRVARDLEKLGARPARNVGNVEQWSQEDCIAPQSKASFRALLQLLDQESRFNEFWNGAQELRTTYQQAGKAAVDKLEDALLHDTLALTRLREQGLVSVSLAGDRGTRMALYRIENVQGQRRPVVRSRTRSVFEGVARRGPTVPPPPESRPPWRP